MGIVLNLLLFLHVLVCLLMVLLVLMQRPKQEGLGAAFASGMMSESFGAQTTDVLQKGTRIMAIAFFVLVTLMAMIQARSHQASRDGGSGLLDEASEATPGGEPAPSPVLPIPPVDETPGGTPAEEPGEEGETSESGTPEGTEAPGGESGEGAPASNEAGSASEGGTASESPSSEDGESSGSASPEDEGEPVASDDPGESGEGNERP